MSKANDNQEIEKLHKRIAAAVDRAWQQLRLNNDLNGEVRTHKCTQILVSACEPLLTKLAKLTERDRRHAPCHQALTRIALLKGRKLCCSQDFERPDAAYEIGSTAAFDQCAEVAQKAIDATSNAGSEDPSPENSNGRTRSMVLTRKLRQGDTVQFTDGRSVTVSKCEGKVTVKIKNGGDHIRVVKPDEIAKNEEGTIK